jgi:hypothetical protein
MKKTLIIIPIIVGLIALGVAVGFENRLNGVSEVSATALSQKYNASREIKEKYQLDGASLVRNKIINAELDKYENEPKDEIKVRIGNKSDLLGADAEFVPSIELSRWNEVSFNLEPVVDTLDVVEQETLTIEEDKIIYDTDSRKYEMYEVQDEEFPEGAYKYVWYLKEKPATNKIEFTIQSQGLDFFYQPELTQEEKDEGAEAGKESQDDEKEENVKMVEKIDEPEDFENTEIPFKINGSEMGVSFETWLKTSPEDTAKQFNRDHKWENRLFLDRNFYPHVDMIINDLYSKGLIEAGEYDIKIDW